MVTAEGHICVSDHSTNMYDDFKSKANLHFLPLPQAVYEVMRAEGALCIADEVQCGFGRVGEAFWAFEPQGIVPDMLTIGKSIGEVWKGGGR